MCAISPGIVPGSHRREGPAVEEEAAANAITVTMPAGALLVWTGALWHAGGSNTSSGRSRRALNFNFALNWLRQEENQTLCVPHDVVLSMPPRLQQVGDNRTALTRILTAVHSCDS